MIKDTRGKAWAVFFSVIMVLSMVAMSVTLVGTVAAASGTEDDPHEIYNWTELAEVNDNPAEHYVLVNNLNDSTEGYDEYASSEANGGNGWKPLGPDDNMFSGTFDGDGHTIDNLHIDRPDDTLNGLFGYVDTGGVVRNVGVTDVNITGQNQAGGLVGRNNGKVETSYSTGVVEGRERTGGLVGHTDNGIVTNSYSRAEVISDHEKIGGLVGDNSNSEIRKSYSAGIVDEADEGSSVGGLTGQEDGDTVVKDSFWDTETSGQDTSGDGTGKTTDEMKDVTTFTDEGTEGLDIAWDFVDDPNDDTASEDIWNISTSLNGGYPYLGDNPPYQVDVALDSPEDGETDIETPAELAVTATSPVDTEINVSFSSMTGWDIETTTFTREVSTEDSGPEGIHFSPDGETMYELGYSDEQMHQYQLTTPWDISTATLEATQDNVNRNSADIFISPEGDHLYELARDDAEIYQLEITDGDISTADTDSPKTTIDTQGSDPEDIHFSPDGTNLFELDSDSQTIYKYELDIAWELSTATYTDSVGAESGATGLFIDQDGDTLYQTSETESKIHQSELETAWDISSVSEDPTSVSISEGDGHGLFINPTGTELYSVGRSDEAVYQYSLDATPELIHSVPGVQSDETATYSWSIDSSSYYEWRATADDGSESATSETRSFATAQKDRPATELNSPEDGDTDVSVPPELNVTATSAENNDLNVSFYSVTGWDIETARYDEVEVDTKDTGPEGIHFSAEGTILYVMGYSDEKVYQFSLTTPWDLSTAEFEKSQENVDTNSADLFVSPDGENYYELEKADGEIHWMDMDGGDIESVNTGDIRSTMATQSSDPEDLHFSPDGTKLYELSNSDIYEYDLSTAWNLSTATYTGKSIPSQDSASTGLFIHPNGTRMYEVGDGDDELHQFTLSTAWDLSTATADDVSTDLEHGDAHSLFFKPTGTQLYYVGRDAERAYSYSLDATPELIDTTSDVNSGTDVTYTWDTVDSLRYYEWLVTADDGSADYTSSTWNFTTDDVTPIESWSQLNDVRDDPSGSYVLSNDLDKDSDGYDTYGSDWDSIGTFEGSFDGQGHTIADLSGNNGLFSEIDGATIENVTLNDVDIGSSNDGIGTLVGVVDSIEKSTIFEVRVTGDVHGEIGTGGLIGVNNYADVSNSSFSGTITSEGKNTGGLVGYETGGNDYTNVYTEGNIGEGEDAVEENNVGGLIGFFDSEDSGGSVTDSYATTTVSAERDSGGLIGRNLGANVTDSHARGNIAFSEGPNTGGLVGYDGGDNTYTRVYATGNIEETHEENNAGGLIGHFDSGSGSIYDSYATGDVDGDNLVGGLIGKNDGASVYNSYSVGKVTSSSEAGGLIGSDNGGSYSNSFWDTETSGQDSSDGGIGLTTAQMQDYNSFTNESNSWLDAAWDFVGTENDDAGTDEYWEMDQDGTVNDNYPILTWQDGADGALTVGADSVAVETQPEATQTAGEVLSGPPEVTVTDEDGNAVEGVDVTVSENGSYTFDSGTTTQTTGSDGIAAFDDLVINTADTGYQLDFSIDSADDNVDSDDTANSQTFEVESADADSVSVTGDTTTAPADGTSELQYTATVEDKFGNAVEGVEVVTSDDGSNISYDGDDSLNTDASGQVVVTATSTEAQSDVIFTFTEQANSNDATASGSFEAGAADSVSADDVTVEAADSGQEFTVDVTDADGNLVDGETVAITANDSLSGISVDDTEDTTDGTATFSFGESTVGTYTVEVALDSDNGVSDTLTVTVEDAGGDSVAIQTEPDATQTAGEALSGPPEVNVTDEDGNAVEGVDVTVSENGSYTFDSGTTTQTTGSDGIAAFDDLVINTADTGYQLDFSIDSADDTANSQTFEVESAAADSVSVSEDETTATADGSDELQYTAMVEDEFDNPVKGVEVVTSDTGSNINYDGDDSLTTDENGEVVVTATSTEAQSDVEFTFTEQDNNNEATATGTFETGDAASVSADDVTVEAADSGQEFTVDVTDENGNPVDGETVAITANDDSLSGISVDDTAETNAEGTATFSSGENTAGTYDVEVALNSDNEVSDTLTATVESAAADSITIQTQPDITQTANETLTGLPAVNVTDEHSNAVEGVDVTVALKPVGDSEKFDSKSTLTVLTNKSGIATFDNLVVNTATGDYRLEFSVNPSVTSELFSMEAAADTTPPEITDFSVDNTERQTVEVSFDSNEELNAITVNGTDDADETTLGKNDFTESGNPTDGFTYTATLSGNEDGTFGATLDTAEDEAGHDGADGESGSVTVDTSSDNGDDSDNGGSGGGSSSGSGSGSSGGDDGDNGDDDAETDQPQPVTRQPSDDGSVGFTVSDSDGAGDIALSVTDEADDGTEELTERNVDHDSLSVRPTENGSREFNVSVRQWDASSETNESTNDRFFEGTGSSAIGYVEVTHSNSDDDIEGVTFQFRVRSAYLDEHDIESEDIALYRDEASGWNELDATEVETTDTHHVFEAESPGLSLFAVGAPDSTEPTNGPEAVATVSPDSVAEGEEVTLDASDSTDDDGEIVAYEWSVDGETLTGETVTLTVEEAGEYTVELTVTNEAGGTNTATADLTVTAVDDGFDDKASTETDDETLVGGAAGFAIYAIIALLVVVIAAIIGVAVMRRRSEDDDSLW